VHALPSAVQEVSGVSDREPGGPWKPHPLSVGPLANFSHFRYFPTDPPTPAKPLNSRLF
jgi:hypothetical protein